MMTAAASSSGGSQTPRAPVVDGAGLDAPGLGAPAATGDEAGLFRVAVAGARSGTPAPTFTTDLGFFRLIVSRAARGLM
jgi:hypothetical protein